MSRAGLHLLCVRLSTGSIPGPIVFGSVIDVSCLLWQDQCGEQGSCYVYQNSAMSQYMLMVGIIYKVLLYIRTLAAEMLNLKHNVSVLFRLFSVAILK